MKNGPMQNRRTSCTAMLAVACIAGTTNAQVGGGGAQLPPPAFEPAVVFATSVGGPYGVASADFLDANGNPGQDGYPEIAVAGAGVLLFNFCDDDTVDHSIRIMRNTGDWDPPADGLVSDQTLSIPGNIRATELVFADVTGLNGPDLVLLGYDSDTQIGYMLVYKNRGDGEFDDGSIDEPPSEFTVSGVSLRGLVAEDFDLDGTIDIAAAVSDCIQTSQPRDKIVMFKNITTIPGSPEFTSSIIQLDIAFNDGPGDVVAGDFYPLSPGAPLLDLMTSNPLADSISKAANLGNLVFSSGTEGILSGCDDPGWSFVTAAAGKFGADGHWDFAAVHTYELFAGVFKGGGLGQFESYCDDSDLGYQLYTQDFDDFDILRAHGIASGNLNSGPNLDLVVAIREQAVVSSEREWNSAVAVMLGLADGTFQTPSELSAYIFSLDDPNGFVVTDGAALVEIVDLDADGFDDIIVTNHHTENITMLINSMSVNPG